MKPEDVMVSGQYFVKPADGLHFVTEHGELKNCNSLRVVVVAVDDRKMAVRIEGPGVGPTNQPRAEFFDAHELHWTAYEAVVAALQETVELLTEHARKAVDNRDKMVELLNLVKIKQHG